MRLHLRPTRGRCRLGSLIALRRTGPGGRIRSKPVLPAQARRPAIWRAISRVRMPAKSGAAGASGSNASGVGKGGTNGSANGGCGWRLRTGWYVLPPRERPASTLTPAVQAWCISACQKMGSLELSWWELRWRRIIRRPPSCGAED